MTTIRRSPVRSATVLRTEQLTPRMRRVTVRCDELRGVAIRPAQDVELHLREPGGRRVKRRYTIRHWRSDDAQADLDVLLHGDGAGSDWGRTARPGDHVEFQGPRGKLELRPAPFHLLVGDESALPAIAAITESLAEPSVAVVEVRSSEDELEVRGDVRWVHRGDHPPGTADLLRPPVAGVAVPPDAQVYLMGETRSMVALRADLEARGVAHGAFFVKGYWNLGRPDRIAGSAPTR